MTQTHPCARLALTLAVVMATASLAYAGEPAATADAEYERGKAALKAGDSATALHAFKSGLTLAGEDEGTRWQLVLAIGLTYEEGGQPHHAVEYYQRFLNQSEEHRDALSPKWHKRRGLVQGNITRLEKRMAPTFGYLTVASEPTGVQVVVNGKRAGADGDAVTPVGFYLPVGTHTVSVRLAGHKLAEKTIELAPGKIRPLRFALEPEPVNAAAPIDDAKAEPLIVEGADPLTPLADAAEIATTSAAPDQGPGLGPWFVIGSAGAVAVAAGAFAGLGASARSDWEDLQMLAGAKPEDSGMLRDYYVTWKQHEQRVADIDLMTGVFAGAAVVTGVGGLLWLLLSDDGAEATAAPALTVTPTAGGALGHASWGF